MTQQVRGFGKDLRHLTEMGGRLVLFIPIAFWLGLDLIDAWRFLVGQLSWTNDQTEMD